MMFSNSTACATLEEAKDLLATYAPAALNTTTPHERTSENYNFLPTLPIVEAAYDHGFRLASASQQGLTRQAKTFDKTTGVHLLRFRREGAVQVGDSFAETVVRNGHAANATFKTFSGAFRLACSNGMIIPVSGTTAEGFKLVHRGDHSIDELVKGVVDSAARADATMEKTIEWGALPIAEDNPEDEQFQTVVKGLVGAGVKARWGSWDALPQSEDRVARDFIAPRRWNDATGTLWTIFNRVQENMIRGTRSNYTASRKRVRKIRECKQIDVQNRLNAALWSKTEELADYLKG